MRGGYFASYLKPLLKMKHEASGWPKKDMTNEEQDSYIVRIEELDDVRLDKDKISENPGLRTLAKLFLNAAWGKFYYIV